MTGAAASHPPQIILPWSGINNHTFLKLGIFEIYGSEQIEPIYLTHFQLLKTLCSKVQRSIRVYDFYEVWNECNQVIQELWRREVGFAG